MTTPPPLSPDEPVRLQALRAMNIVETPLEERFERITRLTQRLLDMPVAAISLIEADRQWFKSIQGCCLTETSRDISFCGHAILQSDVFVIEDARNDPRFSDNPLVTGKHQVVFYAGAPVHAEDGSHIGVLCVNDHKPRTFGEDEINSLRDMAQLAETELRSAASSAVQASLIEACSAEKRRSKIDGLTRVWNRQGIEELACDAVRCAAKEEDGVAFVVIDLDGFKYVNDTYGHCAGDEVLRAASKRMISAVRSTDTVGRLGGDEFLLVLSPCDGPATAREVAERVRHAIVDESYVVDAAGTRVEIGASLGGCVSPGGVPCSVEPLLDEADKAMYRSKADGKNRVTFATENTPQSEAA